MLITLSAQEQGAVAFYNKKIRNGDTNETPVWVDGFSVSIFNDMPPNGEIIDVGCGIGRSISMLPDLGVTRYFGVDPAESQVAYCKKTYPQFDFEVNEIRSVGESYPNRFNGFLLLAVLQHIPRTDIDQALHSLRCSLKNHAQGFMSFPYSDDDVREYAVEDIMCTLYTIEEVVESLERNGFLIARNRIGGQMFLSHLVAV
jgi:SAM-dependent methyltransferase